MLLVAGMVTYISVMQEMGTIDHLAEMAVAIGAPLVALVLCYVIGVTSAFASSTALLTAVIPLALPLLETGALPIVGVVAALAIAATVVDVSPSPPTEPWCWPTPTTSTAACSTANCCSTPASSSHSPPACAGSPWCSHPNSYT